MPDTHSSKRAFLGRSATLLASFGIAAIAGKVEAAVPSAIPLDFPGSGAIPWFKRVFHMYAGPDGLSRVEQLPLDEPQGAQIATFLRRTAERVTIGGSAPHAGFNYHVANQPTLLIPLFGTMVIELKDGSTHELRHGDIAIAEDCSGSGHISRAGADGSFMVAVQLPKPGCPASGSSDMTKFWRD
jgi:hypothetical protein